MIELKYDIDAQDWYRFMSTTTVAITRWAEVQGQLKKDEYGYFYGLKLREPKHLKPYWVLRPATLHLGAHKLMKEAHQHGPGWSREIADCVRLISKPKDEFRLAHTTLPMLDLITQLALFREVTFA